MKVKNTLYSLSNSLYINGKYVVSPKDAEKYFTSDNRRNYVMGDMMPASTVAKKYHVSYKSVLKKVRSGECPSVIYQHYYYIDPKIPCEAVIKRLREDKQKINKKIVDCQNYMPKIIE